jgi:polyisoprenoid-binding protein YceI
MSINLLRHSRCALRLTVVVACLGMFGASPASAETFKVSTSKQLEEAVTKANANGVANTIELAAGTYLPTKSLIFTNTGGMQTVAGPAGTIGVATPEAKVDGGQVTPVTGVSEHELITVKTGVTVTLKHVVVTSGGGEGNPGIEDAGTVNVENATISGNLGSQILVQAGATANLTNSTLSDGHEFGLVDEGTASLLNVTVVHNATGGIGGTGAGTLHLKNTIVALNGAPQCGSNTITNDHSLISDESCGGEAAFKNKTALLQTSLLNDGGSTTIYSEKAGSPSLDAGDPAACPAIDQRGYPRPDVASTACDIGADEYSPTPPHITVPAEIVTPATSSSGAVVTFSVEATDPDALVKSLNCLPASGATFPIGTTKVECTAVDGHENKATASFNVTVNAAACAVSPTIETQPSGQTVTEPAAASFKVKEGTIPTNCAAATIQWELSTNGGVSFTPITGATSATYTINPTHTSETGDQLRAVLTNTHGKTTSTTATLTVNTAACAVSPTIETQPSGQTVTEPAAASFKVKEGTIPANCAAATIQWELSTNGGVSFTPITGATSATYTINPTHTSETGDQLRAVLTNTHGKTTSTTATLTVNTAATSPEAAIHQLLQEVSSSTIPHGTRHRLSCLLSKALRSLAGLSGYGPSKCGAALLSSKVTKVDRRKSGRPGACEDLQEFIDVIGHDQHSRKPKIPAELAKAWSKAAHDIEASLGCTSHDKSPGHSSRHAHGHRGHRSGGR